LIERVISVLTLRNYGAQQLLLEQEAFAVQCQPNAVALIVRALEPWQGECRLIDCHELVCTRKAGEWGPGWQQLNNDKAPSHSQKPFPLRNDE
jgi:hypothetical protein